MSIPLTIIVRTLAYVVKTAPKAYNRTGQVIEKFAAKKFGKYLVEIERRSAIGADGGISQIIRFLVNDATREVWHVVVRAGRIIHKHRL